MERNKSKLKATIIMFWVASGLAILMAVVLLISILKDVQGYVESINDSLFGTNGTLNSLISTYIDSGVLTLEQIENIMASAIKTVIYEQIIFSAISIILSGILILLTIKLYPFANNGFENFEDNMKLFKPIKTLAILEIIAYRFTSSFPIFLDPIFILMLVTIIMYSKEIRKVMEQYYYEMALRDKGVVLDAYGNVVDSKDNRFGIFEQVPIDGYKEEKVEEVKEKYVEPTPTRSNEDMEKIYMDLALLEKRYKNNEISEAEYQENKQELLNKIK